MIWDTGLGVFIWFIVSLPLYRQSRSGNGGVVGFAHVVSLRVRLADFMRRCLILSCLIFFHCSPGGLRIERGMMSGGEVRVAGVASRRPGNLRQATDFYIVYRRTFCRTVAIILPTLHTQHYTA
jgi:hypothetical protein